MKIARRRLGRISCCRAAIVALVCPSRQRCVFSLVLVPALVLELSHIMRWTVIEVMLCYADLVQWVFGILTYLAFTV